VTVAEALSCSGIDLSEARLLLGSASGLSRAAMAAHPDAQLRQPAVDSFLAAVARRRSGEPIAYLVGEREFYGVSLAVAPAVLIPRPETELLVDFALEQLPPGGRLLDLGTGSGAIALAVKQQRPDVLVTAVEQSPAALAIARQNAARHALEVEFLQGSWFVPVHNRCFNVVVSNPPYVADGDPHLGQGDLRFEPHVALVSGADGLDAIREISRLSLAHILRGGWLAIEHGQGQDDAVRNMFIQRGLESVSSRPDLAGIARISVGKYNPD
jgi:release factor glutamine methyltransferase